MLVALSSRLAFHSVGMGVHHTGEEEEEEEGLGSYSTTGYAAVLIVNRGVWAIDIILTPGSWSDIFVPAHNPKRIMFEWCCQLISVWSFTRNGSDSARHVCGLELLYKA